jgi:hypothetical protein
MAFISVALVELLCQVAMEGIPALEYVLSGACGLLRPRPILLDNKCYRFPRP